MPNEEHYRRLERMYAAAPINEYYEPVIEVRHGEAELSMQVRPHLFHAAEAVHGSVYFKALDDAAWFAVNSLIDECCVLTASFNIYMLRPIDRGELRCAGRVVHTSRRLFIAEAELTDAEGQPLARGSGTFMKTRIPLTPEIGYV